LEFLSHCGPIGVQGYLLAYPVETQDAEKEAHAAATRARSILETTAGHATEEANGNPLVFVGSGGRRRTTN
jgi:hypothetical protein